MNKTFGATERHDQLIVYGKGMKAILIYGYGEENEQGYDWRNEFTHKPDKHEVLQTIVDHVNKLTDEKILTGFTWNNKPVYLSFENQFNYKAAYDLAFQTNGASLPVKFKLGEDEEGKPINHTFRSMDSFTDFYTKVIAHVNTALNEGWAEKDAATEWVETLDI